MKHILFCPECKKYTMKELCTCGSSTTTTKPARYTFDNMGKYRREARKEELTKKGFL